uniref:Uncharacterized protein n=1 Tax=Globisporangium ultimum (strain ATCC 200006 / CBS 805.95 / DAOM BR144) TaxID=431595 RepID=K3WX56_GLOUD
GAKKVHLRVHNGQVELDIIKEAPAQKKEPVAFPAETPKKEVATAAPTTVEKVETLAKEGMEWVENNSNKPAFLAGAVGAAVVMVGVAGVAIAKSRKRSAPTSALDVEAAEADAQAATEEQDEEADENESSSDEESADEAEDTEEKKEAAGVVEGSV